MFLSLHWWNNIVICNKKIKKPWPSPLAPPFRKCLISFVEKKLNENYVEYDFRIGTVLLIFSFFWTDNASCPPNARPPGPPYVKILISIVKKNEENYVKFDFRMGSVLVIFSFFWTVNDLVNASPSPEWYQRRYRYRTTIWNRKG